MEEPGSEQEFEPVEEREGDPWVDLLLKFLAVAVAIGVVVGIGTWVVVGSLGLDDTELSSTGAPPVAPVTPLPTTALPVPTESPSASATDGSEDGGFTPVFPTPVDPADAELFVAASPLFVGPMERINLTGQWPGHDAVGLLVQRKENGEWVDFGVQAQVQIGTFDTWVQTGRLGENEFRVYDPESGTASNAVIVVIN